MEVIQDMLQASLTPTPAYHKVITWQPHPDMVNRPSWRPPGRILDNTQISLLDSHNHLQAVIVTPETTETRGIRVTQEMQANPVMMILQGMHIQARLPLFLLWLGSVIPFKVRNSNSQGSLFTEGSSTPDLC
jgi:hypothetical protein